MSATPSLSRHLDTMLEDQLDSFPESATRLGRDDGAHRARRHRLDLSSTDDLQRWLQRHAGHLRTLNAFDPATLAPMERIDRDAVRLHGQALQAAAALMPHGRPEAAQPYVVTQLSGAWQRLPDFLCSKHPVQTQDDAEAFLDRLAAFGTVVRDETERLERAAAEGVRPPAFILSATLHALRLQLATPAAQAPPVASLHQRTQVLGLDGDWRQRAQAQMERAVRPALLAQAEAVQRLLPGARESAGIDQLPQGEAAYRACIVHQTTLDMDPVEIHRIGRDQEAELAAQIDPLLRAEGWLEGSVAERLAALAKDPRFVYPNDAEGKARLLQELREIVADMQARLPQVFDPLPRAGLEVRGVPPAIEAGAPRGYYSAGPADGSRPGAFYANLRDTRDWKRWYAPSFAYHEGVPGHHLQIALALQTEGISMLRRTLWFAAYGEGWALYAEQLADEMGLYERNPMGRVGYLQSMLFRAARLVVDTGLHAFGWTRQQAIDHLVHVVGETPQRAAAEVDRYCVMPAQALSYKLGHRAWQRLREARRAREGAAFDLRRFHAEALGWGAMPLPLLDTLLASAA